MAQRPVSLARHRRTCNICRHPEKSEIEGEFVSWGSPGTIAQHYNLGDRASVYRHAHAVGLFAKRQQNLRGALARIIEKAGDVEASASAVVAAVQAFARINGRGEWVELNERVSVHQLFERMNYLELQNYAQTGALPPWWPLSRTADEREGA